MPEDVQDAYSIACSVDNKKLVSIPPSVSTVWVFSQQASYIATYVFECNYPLCFASCTSFWYECPCFFPEVGILAGEILSLLCWNWGILCWSITISLCECKLLQLHSHTHTRTHAWYQLRQLALIPHSRHHGNTHYKQPCKALRERERGRDRKLKSFNKMWGISNTPIQITLSCQQE